MDTRTALKAMHWRLVQVASILWDDSHAVEALQHLNRDRDNQSVTVRLTILSRFLADTEAAVSWRLAELEAETARFTAQYGPDPLAPRPPDDGGCTCGDDCDHN